MDPWQGPNNPWPTPVTSQQVFGQSGRTSANGVTFGMPPGFLTGRAHRWQGSHRFHNGATDALSRLLFQEQRHRFLQPLAHHHTEWALWKFRKTYNGYKMDSPAPLPEWKIWTSRAKELAGFKNWLEKEGEGEELYFCRKSRDPDLKGGTHIIFFMCFHFLLRRKTFESNLTYDIPRPYIFFSTPRFAVCFFETYIPHMFFWTSCSSAFWLRGFPWRLKYRYLPRSTTCKWSVVLATVPCHIQRCKNVRFPCGVSQVSLAAPYFVSVKTRHNPS